MFYGWKIARQPHFYKAPVSCSALVTETVHFIEVCHLHFAEVSYSVVDRKMHEWQEMRCLATKNQVCPTSYFQRKPWKMLSAALVNWNTLWPFPLVLYSLFVLKGALARQKAVIEYFGKWFLQRKEWSVASAVCGCDQCHRQAGKNACCWFVQ